MARLFILGAADAEMAAIEKLLMAAGQHYCYAVVGGKRCHGGNAYKADGVDGGADGYDRIVMIECELPGWFSGDSGDPIAPQPEIVRCDHHRPGDPGFGKPAAEFMTASSLGQVIDMLARSGAVLSWAKDGDLLDVAADGLGIDSVGAWSTRSTPQCGSLTVEATVPQNIVLIAAADHCLEAAYAGRCPGVDPAALAEFRIAQKATFRKVDAAVVRAEIEAAKAILRDRAGWTHVEAYPGADSYCPNCDTADHGDCMHPADDFRYADLRDDGTIAELPEAACMAGIPYLATVVEPTGRKKVVLGAANAELVKSFLAGQVVPGLVDMYGDPARGFAGGYVIDALPEAKAWESVEMAELRATNGK